MAALQQPAARPHGPAGGRLQQRVAGTDVRLQLREALVGLERPDLQHQCLFACETLLQQAEAPVLEWFLREAFYKLQDSPGGARRLRYRCAGAAGRHASLRRQLASQQDSSQHPP